MSYDARVWVKFGALYGVSMSILFGLGLLGIIALLDLISATMPLCGSGGPITCAISSITRLNEMLPRLTTVQPITDIPAVILTVIIIFVLTSVISGVLSFIIYSAILHYLGVHLEGYKSIVVISIFAPIFGIAITGLFSSIFPGLHTQPVENLITSIIFSILLTWITASLAFTLWTEVFKWSESELSY